MANVINLFQPPQKPNLFIMYFLIRKTTLENLVLLVNVQIQNKNEKTKTRELGHAYLKAPLYCKTNPNFYFHFCSKSNSLDYVSTEVTWPASLRISKKCDDRIVDILQRLQFVLVRFSKHALSKYVNINLRYQKGGGGEIKHTRPTVGSYVLLTICSLSPFRKVRSDAVRDS